MFGEVGDKDILRIASEADRNTVAEILYKNGYTVQPVRRRKNAKQYEYFVRYEMKNNEIINPEVKK
ncbi:MAG: hypothetical protein LUD12_14035 [Lachnospiraceae bacterium]|nr:hypothetical protein [Lachnospiraceae bacterium]